jgi:hypothetical protein
MKVGHQNGGSLHIKNTVTAGFDLLDVLDDRRIERHLGGAANGPNGLGSATTLSIADQGDAAIFRVNGPVVSKQEIASDKCALALLTFERALFRVCDGKSD